MARGLKEYKKVENPIFELDALGVLKNSGIDADLSFQYMCQKCKRVFPIYFYRCPNCHEIGSTKIQYSIIKSNYEKNIPFL